MAAILHVRLDCTMNPMWGIWITRLCGDKYRRICDRVLSLLPALCGEMLHGEHICCAPNIANARILQRPGKSGIKLWPVYLFNTFDRTCITHTWILDTHWVSARQTRQVRNLLLSWWGIWKYGKSQEIRLSDVFLVSKPPWVWFNFCFTALQHISPWDYSWPDSDVGGRSVGVESLRVIYFL